MEWTSDRIDELRALLGGEAVLATAAERLTYDTDALTIERARPDVVVLPRSTDEVSAVVRWAAHQGAPLVPRGAGTGLAGGAIAEFGGIVLSMNRMDQVIRVDLENRFAWVQPGLVNLWLSQRLAPDGLYFA